MRVWCRFSRRTTRSPGGMTTVSASVALTGCSRRQTGSSWARVCTGRPRPHGVERPSGAIRFVAVLPHAGGVRVRTGSGEGHEMGSHRRGGRGTSIPVAGLLRRERGEPLRPSVATRVVFATAGLVAGALVVVAAFRRGPAQRPRSGHPSRHLNLMARSHRRHRATPGQRQCGGQGSDPSRATATRGP